MVMVASDGGRADVAHPDNPTAISNPARPAPHNLFMDASVLYKMGPSYRPPEDIASLRLDLAGRRAYNAPMAGGSACEAVA